MIMADVLTWFLVIIGTWVVLNCYWLTAAALFPRVVDGCAERYARRPIAATMVGVGILAPLMVFAITAMKVANHPLVGGAMLALLSVPAFLALIGSAGLARRIGAGLSSDTATMPVCVARGGAVLAFTFLLPLVGWFVVLPFALVSGFGASVMVLWSRAFSSRSETAATTGAARRVQAVPGDANDAPSVITVVSAPK